MTIKELTCRHAITKKEYAALNFKTIQYKNIIKKDGFSIACFQFSKAYSGLGGAYWHSVIVE